MFSEFVVVRILLKFMINIIKLKQKLPAIPGVYLMRSKNRTILYVGKAANLKHRVMSYFERPQEKRIERMLELAVKIDIKKTSSVIEALMLEAQLIKKYQPQYNILEKDDKSFLRVVFTREKFSRVIACREAEAVSYQNLLANFGPFTSGGAVRAALKVLRRIFPWSDHDKDYIFRASREIQNHGTSRRARGIKTCFNYSIGLCPGTCAGRITPRVYKKNIRALLMIFRGKGGKLLRDLKKEMRLFSHELKFEEARTIKSKIDALQHINDVALLRREEDRSGGVIHRIEGYDISNTGSAFAVGSMVVFTDGIPDPKEYRKFRIKMVTGQNDAAMLAEVLRRRFGNDWPKPDIILIDGGLPQVNSAKAVISNLSLGIPVVGIAKGPERKRNDFFYPPEMHAVVARNRDILVRVRDSAHKFAIKYHRQLRDKL